MVKCIKLGKELPGLEYPPFGGELGDRIWADVSEEAWKMFVDQFKMLMNQERLEGGTERATKFFLEQAKAQFYGPGMEQPTGYVPPAS